MGGLMPSAPKMPKMKAPVMPETPRMPSETDPEIEKRARARKGLRGRRSTLLADRSKRTTQQITSQSLGGSSGKDFPGLK